MVHFFSISVVDTVGVHKCYEWIKLAAFTRFTYVFLKDNLRKCPWRKFLHRRCFCGSFHFFCKALFSQTTIYWTIVWTSPHFLVTKTYKIKKKYKQKIPKFDTLHLHITLLYNYICTFTWKLHSQIQIQMLGIPRSGRVWTNTRSGESVCKSTSLEPQKMVLKSSLRTVF